MSTSRRSRYREYLGFTITFSSMLTITLAISLLCGMTVPLDSCTHDIGILLALFYFITEVGILAMLLSWNLPLTNKEHNFIDGTGLYICFTPSIASICNLILMIDVHAKCRNQLATHIMALYWIAVLLSLCMLVGAILLGLTAICSRMSKINSMIKRIIEKKRRNDKHDAIIRSMSGDIMRSQRLSISTLSQYTSFMRQQNINFRRQGYSEDGVFEIMPHEFASHATVIYALFTDISHISDAHTCSICNHAIIGGHRVMKAIKCLPRKYLNQDRAYHTSCLMAMLTAVYHGSDKCRLSLFLKILIDKIREHAEDGGVNAIET